MTGSSALSFMSNGGSLLSSSPAARSLRSYSFALKSISRSFAAVFMREEMPLSR